MLPNELKINLINELSTIMSRNEAQSELDFILTQHLGISKTALILEPKIILDHEEELKKIVEKRITTREPLQYILSKALFYGNTYYVDKNVLIPRPETELLVLEVLKYANKNTKILDIGTGSGCIAISLAKHLNSDNITAIDISQEALDVAKINHQNLCPKRNINFIKSDLFENINDKFDIIVSNPPYISPILKKDMQKEVLEYEPHNALFAEDEGLYFYKKIINLAPNYLNDNSTIAFELGIDQSDKVKEFLLKEGFSKTIIITDFGHIDRIITACYNRSVKDSKEE